MQTFLCSIFEKTAVAMEISSIQLFACAYLSQDSEALIEAGPRNNQEQGEALPVCETAREDLERDGDMNYQDIPKKVSMHVPVVWLGYCNTEH